MWLKNFGYIKGAKYLEVFMKRIFLGLFFTFIGFGLFAQATDAQIKQAATTLGVPYEALRQFVESYRPNTAPTGILTLTAADLSVAYKNNAIRADGLYKGKQLQITGTIYIINTDYEGTYIRVADNYLTVHFRSSENAKIGNLSKGQSITFVATCDSGNGYGYVDLSDAILVQ
jgi:hypothetical protein